MLIEDYTPSMPLGISGRNSRLRLSIAHRWTLQWSADPWITSSDPTANWNDNPAIVFLIAFIELFEMLQENVVHTGY